MSFIVSEFVLWVLLLYRFELIQVLRQGIGALSVELCKKKSMMTMIVIPMTCLAWACSQDLDVIHTVAFL